MGKNSGNDNVLQHVALIMDGNRRWAVKHGLGPVEGHRVAAEKIIKPIVKRAIARGIKYITFWAFSTENKTRDKEEVEGLFGIFRDALKSSLVELDKMGVRLNLIGDIDWFPQDIAQKAKDFVKKTKDNTTITVSFALNYGGREEILRAVNKILAAIRGKKRPLSQSVTADEFAAYLDTAGIPDPELIIRTGGNKRLSGYFPWQSVYSELYFTKTLWPDFTPAKFDQALLDFAQRTRRFGGGSFKDYVTKAALRRLPRKVFGLGHKQGR